MGQTIANGIKTKCKTCVLQSHMDWRLHRMETVKIIMKVPYIRELTTCTEYICTYGCFQSKHHSFVLSPFSLHVLCSSHLICETYEVTIIDRRKYANDDARRVSVNTWSCQFNCSKNCCESDYKTARIFTMSHSISTASYDFLTSYNDVIKIEKL